MHKYIPMKKAEKREKSYNGQSLYYSFKRVVIMSYVIIKGFNLTIIISRTPYQYSRPVVSDTILIKFAKKLKILITSLLIFSMQSLCNF